MARDKLTSKQMLFANHYIKYRNGTEAARVAGYKGTDKALAVQANKNLKNANILDYINKRLEKVDKKEILSLQEVLEEITHIAMDRPNVSPKDRLKALELLGKTHAAFKEKTINENTHHINMLDDWVKAVKE